MTLLIDAYEGRYVGTYDFPGVFLQAGLSPRPNNEQVLMRLIGNFVDIMCKMSPEHPKNAFMKMVKKVLYLEVLQAIYGYIESALKWYELYSETLSKEIFVINPYDRCVTNKTINGKQCTIVWYVDDNKISHEDPEVVTKVIELMKKHFGNLTITRGNKHRFLGMNITISPRKSIEIEIKDHLRETIDMLVQNEGSEVNEEVTSLARPRLRDMDPNCKPLCELKVDAFSTT